MSTYLAWLSFNVHFNIGLTSTPDGLRISHNDASDITTFVNYSVAKMPSLRRCLISPASDWMKPDNLHYTAHVTTGPDEECSKRFFRDIMTV